MNFCCFQFEVSKDLIFSLHNFWFRFQQAEHVGDPPPPHIFQIIVVRFSQGVLSVLTFKDILRTGLNSCNICVSTLCKLRFCIHRFTLYSTLCIYKKNMCFKMFILLCNEELDYLNKHPSNYFCAFLIVNNSLVRILFQLKVLLSGGNPPCSNGSQLTARCSLLF